MDQFLLRTGHASVLVVEVIALVWIGKKALELSARVKFREELMGKDNPAAGVALAGFLLALFISLSGLLMGKPGPLGHDALLVGLHGAGAIAALVVSSFLWTPIVHLSLRSDVIGARNLGAGLLSASLLVATGLVYQGAVSGQGDNPATVAVFFALGEGALLLFLLLYEWTTPYGVYEEIGEKGNTAAALAFSGATIAAGLILGNAVEGEFTDWQESIREALEYMIPLLVLPLVRWVVVNGLLLGFGNVNREIVEDRNPAAGLLEGAAYVGIALFAVHLLT